MALGTIFGRIITTRQESCLRLSAIKLIYFDTTVVCLELHNLRNRPLAPLFSETSLIVTPLKHQLASITALYRKRTFHLLLRSGILWGGLSVKVSKNTCKCSLSRITSNNSVSKNLCPLRQLRIQEYSRKRIVIKLVSINSKQG
jgi:hypothetical protein